MEQPFTTPLDFDILEQKGSHSFLYAPKCPINLLGRDLMGSLQITLACNLGGITLYHPAKPAPDEAHMFMLIDDPKPEAHEDTTIYWQELTGTAQTTPGLESTYREWEMWIQEIGEYNELLDPLHCTLNITHEQDLTYDEPWYNQKDGQLEDLRCGDIYLGPEGVAAGVDLTEEQLSWFQLEPESVPHVSLLVSADHQPKQLGPMVKRAQEVREWQPTDNQYLHRSPNAEFWRISSRTTNKAIGRRVDGHRMVIDNTTKSDEPEDPEVTTMLTRIKETVWANGPYDVGHTPQHNIVVNVKNPHRPEWRHQYRIKPEAEEGINDTITGLLEAGVLEKTTSEWNTPILPVRKADGLTWRMVHDLRAINIRTIAPPEKVPNPYVALNPISSEHQWFTVVDLANAFFCIPLATESRQFFAFTYRNQQYTYRRMPQGFRSTPTIFNTCLKEDLAGLDLPSGTVLIQYVDDLLVAAETKEACLQATENLLQTIAQKGYKLKKTKLQLVKQEITFLGKVIGGNRREIGKSHRSAIKTYPKPITVRQMLAFLGLTGYSRTYIPDYTGETTTLRQLITKAGHRNLKAPLEWTPEAEEAFNRLKQSMYSAAALAAPDYKEPFHLDVSVKDCVVNGILWQKQRGQRNVLAYHSSALEPPEKGLPECGKAICAIAKSLDKTAYIVMTHPVVVHTIHGVKAYLDSSDYTITTATRNAKLQRILGNPMVTFTTQGANMTDTMPGPNDGEPHTCSEEIKKAVKIRPGLRAEPLQPVDMTLYTDGCCYRAANGENLASWAVVEQTKQGICSTLASGILEQPASAQRAELYAMCEALRIAKGRTLNLYTDSNYAYELAHLNGQQMINRQMITSANTKAKHTDLILLLAKTAQLPREVAIMHCRGHQKTKTMEARGNHAADEAAKKAGGYVPVEHLKEGGYTPVVHQMMVNEETALDPDEQMVKEMQGGAGPYEKSAWRGKGARQSPDGIYYSTTGKPVVSSKALLFLLRKEHGLAHEGKTKTRERIERYWWHPALKAVCDQYVQDCQTCQACNQRRGFKITKGQFPVPQLPFQEIYIDFTDMGQENKVDGKRFMLVAVDRFTRWVEAIPVKKEDGKTVIKWLTQELIPRWGYPKLICSDNGTHFANAHLQEVETYIGLKHRFGSVYHPQSQGLVERANQTIKNQLTKILRSNRLEKSREEAETRTLGRMQVNQLTGKVKEKTAGKKMTWITALPLALMAIRSSPSNTTLLSPHELVTGRPMQGPYSPPSKGPPSDRFDEVMQEYLQALTQASLKLYSQITDQKPSDPEDPSPTSVTPGEWIWVKKHHRKTLEDRWEGPYKVLLATPFSVSVEDRRGAQWHHLSRCRKADTPGRSWTETLTDLAALQAKDKHSSSQDDGPQRALGKVPGRIPSGSPVPRRSGRQHRQVPTV